MAPDAPLGPTARTLRRHVIPRRNVLTEERPSPVHPGSAGRRADPPGPPPDLETGGAEAPGAAVGGAGSPPSIGSGDAVTPAPVGAGGGAAVAVRERFTGWLRRSTAGKSWAVRAPLLPLLAWIAWKHAGDIWWSSIFGGVNLAFHEVGHVVFGLSGSQFLTIAGGTIVELLVPVIAAALLARQRDAFGAGVCVFWLGTAFASVGRYIYDTRSQIMDRVSTGPALGPDDWTYLLSRWGLVRQDRVIGMAVKETGVALMVGGIAFGAFVLYAMARQGK